MTGTINACSPCVEYIQTDVIPFQTCQVITPSPAPPFTPDGFGGNLQGAYPPPTLPPNILQTWSYLVNTGPQKGNVYWWYVDDQAWE